MRFIPLFSLKPTHTYTINTNSIWNCAYQTLNFKIVSQVFFLLLILLAKPFCLCVQFWTWKSLIILKWSDKFFMDMYIHISMNICEHYNKDINQSQICKYSKIFCSSTLRQSDRQRYRQDPVTYMSEYQDSTVNVKKKTKKKQQIIHGWK